MKKRKAFLAFSSSLLSIVMLVSCGNSTEEKYIDLLEKRVEELSATENREVEVPKMVLDEYDVQDEVSNFVLFQCPEVGNTLDVQVKRLSSSKWLVRMSYQLNRLDEFGFPLEYTETVSLRERQGELIIDPLLNVKWSCE